MTETKRESLPKECPECGFAGDWLGGFEIHTWVTGTFNEVGVFEEEKYPDSDPFLYIPTGHKVVRAEDVECADCGFYWGTHEFEKVGRPTDAAMLAAVETAIGALKAASDRIGDLAGLEVEAESMWDEDGVGYRALEELHEVKRRLG